MVENLPSSPGDMDSSPGKEVGIPQAAGQLSPHTTATGPVCSGAQMPQLERSLSTTAKRQHEGWGRSPPSSAISKT